MEFDTLLYLLEKEFPSSSALDGDRIGLQIKGNDDKNINTILCAYELTNDVIEEASLKNAELIVLFHPLIYYPLTNVNAFDRVTYLVRELIKREISLYIIHTNFDTHPLGTNNIIADKLGLKNIKYLKDLSNTIENRGMGIFGEFEKVIFFDVLLEKLHSIFSSPIRYCKGKTEYFKNCAFVGGSGYSFINEAIKMGTNCFITADLTYHNFHQHKDNICLIELGHYEMEQFNHLVMSDLISKITKSFNVKVIKSKIVTNPVSYFPENNYKENQKDNILELN